MLFFLVTHQCEFNFWFILAGVSVTRYCVKDPFGKPLQVLTEKKNCICIENTVFDVECPDFV